MSSLRQNTEWVIPVCEKGCSKHSVQFRVGVPSSLTCGAHIPSSVAPQPDSSRANTMVWKKEFRDLSSFLLSLNLLPFVLRMLF